MIDGDSPLSSAEPERAEETLNSIGDAVISTDIAGTVTYLNVAAEVMTGWSREAAVGQPVEAVFHIIDRETRERADNPMSLAIRLNKTVGLTASCILVRRDGQEAEIEDSTAPIRRRDGQVTGAVIVFRDVGSALETSREMSHRAQHDVLTGLPNRPLLEDRLTEAIALARRRHKPVAVFFLDIDGFKPVNDSLGHAVGDRLLRSIATRLCGVLRQSDTVGRYGGDEFVIVLAEVDHADGAITVAKKLLQAVASPHRIHLADVTVTGSLGLSLYPDHGQDANALITSADVAMFHAKRAGPGNHRLFDVRMNAQALERRAIESDLRGALERNELEVYYQPQIELRTNAITGVEALIRWRHPERGLLAAAQFIRVAEASGLIVPIGQWAMRAACRQARAWQEARLRPVRVSVNISAVEFWRRELVDDVRAILQDTGLAAHSLQLEVTEDVLMQDTDAAIATLDALRGMGVQIALDQFGTGRSSLSDLQHFPVDVLKIDPSFAPVTAAGATDARVLNAIIEIGRNLNHRVMAAGVETDRQLAVLHARDCPEAQGYLFSHPIRAGALGELLRTSGAEAPKGYDLYQSI